MKPCMKCRKPFKAEHEFNRICPACTRQNRKEKGPQAGNSSKGTRGGYTPPTL